MRNRHGAPFDAGEFAAIRALMPIIAASLRRHWPQVHHPDGSTGPAPGRADADQVFGDLLTPAQCAVTKLILRGHGSLSIAENLGITEGTVKIQRSNNYHRLGISSQSVLFRRFIDHLTE
ncbi:LuxR C-terminal-related transcriptional regulator [Paracoccus sp. DMF-8]|uniref:helix-turn-helix transcriptional regulator n=1 Tax=Paracoccus sp. DMF-8 TaxID=3019445 RepID=UPI0023E83ABD|nr:LuxR C-terminal-related transcriptional regulator [Paracoccus sp. DMF-8]MDF3605376.1 LuxR C-terminal-related transcriptional regulator [Paracoccus sp. DMF-8]